MLHMAFEHHKCFCLSHFYVELKVFIRSVLFFDILY